jgi:hypothetical protein
MKLPSPRHRTPTPNRNPPASPGSWAVSRSFLNRALSMNRASVAAGVPPAVEGGVSPPGIPGSWSPCAIRESWVLPMNFSMPALARVEPGSLTPALSRRERVSCPALGDMPVPRASEPSQLVPAFALVSRHPHVSWTAAALTPLSTPTHLIRSSITAVVPPAVKGGVSPPGIPTPTRSVLSPLRGSKSNATPHLWFTPWATVLSALRASTESVGQARWPGCGAGRGPCLGHRRSLGPSLFGCWRPGWAPPASAKVRHVHRRS